MLNEVKHPHWIPRYVRNDLTPCLLRRHPSPLQREGETIHLSLQRRGVRGEVSKPQRISRHSQSAQSQFV